MKVRLRKKLDPEACSASETPQTPDLPVEVVAYPASPSTQTVRVDAVCTEPMPVLGRLGVDQDRERRKLKRLPQYACSTCAIGPECPEFREDHVCAYQDAFSAFPSRDVDSVLSLMAEVLEENKKRWRFGLVHERVSGSGLPDPAQTKLSEVVMAQARALAELQREVSRVSISAEVVGGGSSGILSKLFGAPSLPESTGAVVLNPATVDEAAEMRKDKE